MTAISSVYLNYSLGNIVNQWVTNGRLERAAELYSFEQQEPIPAFLLPLRRDDTEPSVDLQALLHGVYDRAGLDLAIDYNREPVPPVSEADTAWANELLQQQGLGFLN